MNIITLLFSLLVLSCFGTFIFKKIIINSQLKCLNIFLVFHIIYTNDIYNIFLLYIIFFINANINN